MKKFIAVFTLVSIVISAFLLGGCSAKTINVSINDMNTESKVEIRQGSTVGDALKEAEISLGENDTVSPEVQTKLVDEGTTISISRYAQVTVTYGKDSKQVALTGATVAQAIEEAGIKLGKNDAVNHDENELLTDGMEIVITKMITVKLTADGKTQKVKTASCTVKELLEAQGIELGENDIVTPSLNKKIKSNTDVKVKRVTTKTVTETEEIEYKTIYKTSDSMKEGTSKVTQQGVKGQKKVKYKVTYIDSVESERTVLEETVIKNAVNKIIVKGTQKATQSTNSGKTIVSKQRVDDCDGSGHGYFVITWSDGSVTYEEY